MAERDQVAGAIHESLVAWDTTAFVEVDWPDRATENIMRRLVAVGALPKECSPDSDEDAPTRAPEGCPHCIDSTDCSHVVICNAVHGPATTGKPT